MVNSINTNIAAYFAQKNIGDAAERSSASVARLSSGLRINKASDDVAALASGTSLKTNVTTLRTALINSSQGTSLLQIADGALSQITDILQRQKAIALQAGSGSLTNTDRGYLDQEFQALTAEIDRLSTSANFNGVKLLNGSLSTASSVADNENAATAGSLSTTFIDNISVGENVIINGVTLTAVASSATATGLQFNVGNSLSETVSNLSDRLNVLADNASYNTTIGAAKYSFSNQTLTATARSGGTLSNKFTLNNAAAAVTVGANTVSTTNGSAAVTVAVTNTYSVGQAVILNLPTSAGIGGITGPNLRGVITSASGSTFTFTALAAATSTVATTNGAGTVTLDVVNNVGEANTNGDSIGSSFNLFSSSTGFTSTTTQISAASGSQTAALAFRNGDTLSATINGITSVLHTFGTSDTLQGLVNGVNASSGTTGFSAALVYNGSTYNVRIDYAGNAGNILLNGGTNYYTTAAATNTLTGLNFSGTANNIGINTTFSGNSLVSTGYIDLTGAAGSVGITVANQTTTVIGTTAAAPFAAGDNVTIAVNGKTQVLHTFVAGDTLNSIVSSINAHTSDTGVYAAVLSNAGGTAFNIRLFTTVPTAASDQVIVSAGANIGGIASSTLTTLTTTNAGLSQVTTASLAGGADDGIGQGNTSVTGTIGNGILQDLGQSKANASILFTANAVANDYITVGGQAFYFTANTTNKAPNEITIGSTIQETINNAITTINAYSANGDALGTTAFELNQLEVSGTANSLAFTAKGLGAVTTLAGANAVVSQNLTSGALVGGTLNNGSTNYGVDVTGISNPAFTGTVQGFTATYSGTANTADLSIKVGDFTYTANDVNAVVTSDTRIRFYSDTVGGKSGGYFDVQLKANQVLAFTNEAGADLVASRLDGAFSSLNFRQERNISSYNGTGSISANGNVIGSLFGSKVTAQFDSFDNVKLTDVKVTAPTGSTTDASIALTINGTVYKTAGSIGDTLGARQTYRLVSTDDPNQFVDFTTGDTAIDLGSSVNAAAAQTALQKAFGADAGSASLSFQIGTTTTDTLSVSIGSASTSSLFGGEALDVRSQANASRASDVLDSALSTVTALRANVGALQSRFNFASANIQVSIQNQDAARGTLLDTDIASESTAYSTAQVQLQAGIAVLAQANQQTQSLLKLIG